MAKKKQIGILGATAIALASALGGAQQANALAPADTQTTTQQQAKKDAVPVQKKQVRTESEKNRHGGFSGIVNPYKHIRKGDRNQRQWRKWLRANPNMRKTKHSK